MGQKIASLEIELAMATGGAVADLNRFGGTVDKVSAQAIRDLDRIDAATQGIGDMSKVTAQMVRFADETARTAISAARELARVERAGESMAAQLDRQLSVFGKTASEVRALKAETSALAAEQAGASELATRIRTKEAELYDLEFAAARQARLEAEAAAEARQVAATAAVQAAERETAAIREAAHAHQMFEARVREGAAAMAAADREAAEFEAAIGRVTSRIDPSATAMTRLKIELDEAKRAFDAARISGVDYEQEQERIAAAAGKIYGPQRQASAALDDGVRRNQFAMRNLGQQFGDFATQVSLGSGVLRAFSSQAGQVGYALSEFEKGPLARIGRFMVGPWGAAFTIAAVAVGPLLEKVLKLGNALDDEVAKLKKQAETADISRRAHERFATSAEGVAAAIRDSTDATRESIKGMNTAAENANIEAKANLARELSIRRVTEARIADTRALIAADIARASGLGGAGTADSAGGRIAGRAAQLADLDRQLAAERENIAAAEAHVQFTRIELAGEAAKRAADPLARINRLYDEQAKAVKLSAVAQVAAGQVVDATLTHQLAVIERTRQAALKAEQDKTAAARETANQIGRNITLSEARGIAESIGGRVTSDHRTFDQQKALYDKYVAYRSGDGPWAALAAKPGTSNHELDQALDVAKSGGVTLKKLIAAYRAAGVTLVEALDEGDHYHVAWKKVGALARQETAEIAAATKQARELDQALDELQRKLDPHAAAEAAYRERIADIDKLVAAKRFTSDEAQKYRVEALHAWWDAEADAEKQAQQKLLANLSIGQSGQQELKISLPDIGSAHIPDFAKQFDDATDAVKAYAQAFGASFGHIGDSIAKVTNALLDHGKEEARISALIKTNQITAADAARLSTQSQIGGYADVAAGARSMFSEHSRIYKGLQAAEVTFRAVQLGLSIASMVQNTTETGVTVANAGVRAAADGTAGIAKQSQLPFPANLAAMAATAAALVGIGVAVLGGVGGGKNTLPKANDGSGTVLGDASAQSASIKNSIDALKSVDDVTLTVSRDMLTSLRAIENNIGGLASLLVRTGDINASADVTEGFKADALGSALSKIPVIGGILGGLFGSKTTVVGSGLYGDSQSLGDILSGGFDASYYSDVQKKKKLFGLTTSTKYKTTYAGADEGIEDQFTLLLRQFYDAIGQAAGPLGASLDSVQAKLLGFTVDIGKIDLQGLTGTEIQEKLEAVFGAAADNMAKAGVPGLERFQKVGEGYFETLVRVASTVEQVDATFQKLGVTTGTMGIDIDMAVAGLFDSVSDFTSAAGAYFETYYSEAEQAAAKAAQLGKVFTGLGLAMPDTLAGFRGLVEAQDLTTAAGQQTYATLLQLAPAFADLKESMDGAKSAADIMSERQDLERQLLDLQGDTVAIRAAELAKLDVSNRTLQQQIYTLQDAQKAAEAADQLRQAWTSVGDSIMDEVNRIRGLTGASTGGSFATLLGSFNAANSAARTGDMDAAKNLPQLSKSLLDAAALAATSRQELDRVQAQTAAMLEATYAAIGGLSGTDAPSTSSTASLAGLAAAQAASTTAGSDDKVTIADLRKEVADMRTDLTAALAQIAANTGRSARTLDNVTGANGGEAISVSIAA